MVDENADEYFIDKNNLFDGDLRADILRLTTVIMSDRPDLSFLPWECPHSGSAIGLTCGAFNLTLSNNRFSWLKYAEPLAAISRIHPTRIGLNAVILCGTKIPPAYLPAARRFINAVRRLDALLTIHRPLYRRMGRVKGKHLSHANILYPDWEESIFVNNEMTDFGLILIKAA